jgi:hypothetical protein
VREIGKEKKERLRDYSNNRKWEDIIIEFVKENKLSKCNYGRRVAEFFYICIFKKEICC